MRFSCCVVLYLQKVKQSCHHFFLPQVYEFMEKTGENVGSLVNQIIKPTLSPHVVAILRLLGRDLCDLLPPGG